MWTETTDIVILGRNYWSSCRVDGLEDPTVFLYKSPKPYGHMVRGDGESVLALTSQ